MSSDIVLVWIFLKFLVATIPIPYRLPQILCLRRFWFLFSCFWFFFSEFLPVFSLLYFVCFCLPSPVFPPPWLIVPPCSCSVSVFHFLCGTSWGFWCAWYACHAVLGCIGSGLVVLCCFLCPFFVSFPCSLRGSFVLVVLCCWLCVVGVVCVSCCWCVWCVFVWFWFCVVLLCSAFCWWLVFSSWFCWLSVLVVRGWSWLVHVAAGWLLVRGYVSWCWLVCCFARAVLLLLVCFASGGSLVVGWFACSVVLLHAFFGCPGSVLQRSGLLFVYVKKGRFVLRPWCSGCFYTPVWSAVSVLWSCTARYLSISSSCSSSSCCSPVSSLYRTASSPGYLAG